MENEDGISVYATDGPTTGDEATPNSLESYSTNNPQGDTDICAKLTITTTFTPFVFYDIASVNTNYVFSFWVKSESAGTITALGATVETSTEWQKQVIMFTATTKDLAMYFSKTGTYYIYHAQLESGNKATDWALAPEDVVSYGTRIEENESNIALIAARVDSNDAAISTLNVTARGVDMTSADTSGTLYSFIGNADDGNGGTKGVWKAEYTKAGESDVSSSLYFDFDNGRFVFNGEIQAKSGRIGAFTINGVNMYTNNKTTTSGTGIWLSNRGIFLGDNKFYVNYAGYLYSTSGKIGGFDITETYLRTNSKAAYNDSTEGVYVGNDGIGLGAGTFYVTNTGYLYSTSGYIGGWTINDDSMSYSDGSNETTLKTARITFTNNLGSADIGLGGATFTESKTLNSSGYANRKTQLTHAGMFFDFPDYSVSSTLKKIFIIGYSDHTYIQFNTTFSALDGISSNARLVGTWTADNDLSDVRIKNTIEAIPEQYETLFDNLVPSRYKYNNGTSGRFHTGFIAQEVVSAVENAGLTTQDFAAVMLMDEGTVDECWCLRRDEFVALNTWQIQKLKARVAELEEKIHNLEAKE